MNTQLTIFNKFNTNRIVFNKPVLSKGTFKNKYIPIKVKYDDGSIGDLIVQTPPNMFSFGITENIDKKSGNVEGYTIPIYLWSKNNPTDEEKEFSDTLLKVVQLCKDYIFEHKDEVGCWDLEKSDLKKIASCIWWKKDKQSGKPLYNESPTLYVKVIGYRNEFGYQFVSSFYDENNGDSISPKDLIQKKMHLTGAIKIESIYIGSDNKIRLQVKLWEACVRLSEMKRTRLLPLKPTNTNTFTSDKINDTTSGYGSLDDENDQEFIRA